TRSRHPADQPLQDGGASLIGEGLTNRQIGRRLYLAEKTVKNHISRLLAKLGVERRIQAAVIATHAQDRQERDAHRDSAHVHRERGQ
ncbi:response regulator transcription factor, partial [Streptomyces jeddahensis]|uniref:response regulator transcription factor n=1 Tax=Streptomyces jeddahensis TaxID=1716141 RepID=UPI000AF80E02